MNVSKLLEKYVTTDIKHFTSISQIHNIGFNTNLFYIHLHSAPKFIFSWCLASTRAKKRGKKENIFICGT